jgi:hypothetical protein
MADNIAFAIIGAPIAKVWRTHQQARVLVVEERQVSRRTGNCGYFTLNAKVAEHMLRTAPQSQARAGFAQLAGSFVNRNDKTRTGEGNGCGQPAQACPDHQHRINSSHGGKLAQFRSVDKDYRLGMSGQLC